MNLPILRRPRIILPCTLIIFRMRDFLPQDRMSVSSFEEVNELLGDFDVLEDSLVGVNGRARGPGEEEWFDERGVCYGGVGSSFGCDEPGVFLLFFDDFSDEVFDDGEVGSSLEDGMFG